MLNHALSRTKIFSFLGPCISVGFFPSILTYMTNKIDDHRKKIDELDAEILSLIEQRVNEAISIRQLKIKNDLPLFTPEREEELIKTLVDRSQGKLPREVIEDIWMTIIKGGKRTGERR